MNRKILVSILAVVILAFVHPAEAQQTKKLVRIGILLPGTATRCTSLRHSGRGCANLATRKGKTLSWSVGTASPSGYPTWRRSSYRTSL